MAIPILGFLAIGSLLHIMWDISGLESRLSIEHSHAFFTLDVQILVSSLSWGGLMGLIRSHYFYPEIINRPEDTILDERLSVLDIVKYTSSEDEVNLMNSIKKFDNGAYQFEIASLCNLSRMKVHRVIKRLVDRQILRKEGEGRNSKIYLSTWITNNSHLHEPQLRYSTDNN
ncbi:MAG: hypothetical protein IH840_09870 [Candidatus Heimdallarchaeota archaeon]|nr:hypothetical protein [Candidatus Heimdallarchaeota archaeon]